MKLQWESYNLAWEFYLNIDWKNFFMIITLAGINMEFHICNVRDICYGDD